MTRDEEFRIMAEIEEFVSVEHVPTLDDYSAALATIKALNQTSAYTAASSVVHRYDLPARGRYLSYPTFVACSTQALSRTDRL